MNTVNAKDMSRDELVKVVEGLQEAVQDPEVNFDPETGILDGPGWMEYPDGQFVVITIEIPVDHAAQFWAAHKSRGE